MPEFAPPKQRHSLPRFAVLLDSKIIGKHLFFLYFAKVTTLLACNSAEKYLLSLTDDHYNLRVCKT